MAWYRVKSGDTIKSIYAKFQMEVEDEQFLQQVKKDNSDIWDIDFLHPGQQLYLTMLAPDQSPELDERKDESWIAMREYLAGRESGGNYQQPPNDYGFIGRYQFGQAILNDLGYYTDDPDYFDNKWEGEWKGIDDITGDEKIDMDDFLTNPSLQDRVIVDALERKKGYLENFLQKNGGTIENYLGRTREIRDKDGVSVPITLTLSGMLAGAHLVGEGKVGEYLLNGTVPNDPAGTSVLEYITRFNGYDVPL